MGFDAGWLDLREPMDAVSRDPALLDAAADFLAGAPDPLAVDLGCGTGSSIRAFASRAPAGLRWRLVDNDPRLLAIAAERGGAAVETREMDLCEPDGVPLEGARLVTASALLDLVSEAWIEALARRVAAAGAGFHATLIYDGVMHWSPARPDDADIVAAFNAHQRRDKGFGPSLGPDAGRAAAAAFGRHGYRVQTGSSPWRIAAEGGAGGDALHRDLVDGVAGAAAETGLAAAQAWGQARRAARGMSSCVVGHVDLLALPEAARAQSNRTSPPRP